MKPRVLVIGDGSLATYVHTLNHNGGLELIARPALNADTLASVDGDIDIAVVLEDGWYPQTHEQAESIFRDAGIPWLRGFVVFGEAIVGPLVRPHVAGCSQCADARRWMTMEDRNEMWRMKAHLMMRSDKGRDVYVSHAAVAHVGQLIYAQLLQALQTPTAQPLAVITVNLKTLATSRHRFLPDPSCSVCGTLPDDTPDLAEISMESAPKQQPNHFRLRSLTDLQKFLTEDYVDYRTGLLNARVHDLIAPYAAVSVNLPLTVGDEGASGRAHTYAESELTAILEGLERYCGIEPRRTRNFVTDTYAHLQEIALDPRKVGIHSAEQYRADDFPFQPFAEDLPLEWVWAYSMTERRPIMVPKLLAYYSLGHEGGFVYETSNGCALGGSMAEAIFHGVLEVVERDAFLLTWYAQLPLPRIDVASIDDLEVQLMVERLRRVVGYELHLFNATMENGIPTVFAVAKNRRERGLNLMSAAGSHVDALRAVKGAIHEIAGMLLRFDEKLEHHREAYLQMLYDDALVQDMDQHSMLYGLPEAEHRFDFLLKASRVQQTFQEAFAWPHRHLDLTEDVADLLAVFSNLNLDVMVVNQTSPELARNGLVCVKVLIPGMLPMTFGHHLTRLEGLERVLRVPMELGFASEPLTPNQLNPHPHPFP